MKKINLLLLLLCLSLAGFSQTSASKVTGYVYSQEGQPLSFANVFIKELNKGAVADEKGKFTINDMQAGDYTLSVSMVGFETTEQKISVKSGETCNVNCKCSESGKELKEVVVTAEKKEERLQKVPVSVTALDQKKLNDLRVWDSRDITGVIPNVNVMDIGAHYLAYSARGISAYSYDPVITTYLDDVPLFSLNSTNYQLFDVSSFEMLRGPQGTLYGRNAMGGIINIRTNQPTNIFKGRTELSFGNFNQQRYSVALSGPIIKGKLFAGFNGTYDSRDGYYENTFLKKNFNGQKGMTGNFTLKYLPNNKFSFALNVKGEANEYNGYPSAPNDSIALADPYKYELNDEPIIKRNLLNSSFTAKYYGRKFNITSVSAINNTKLNSVGKWDVDYTKYDLYSFAYAPYGRPDVSKNFYQEMRLSSVDTDSSKFKWIVGGIYFRQTQDQAYLLSTGADAAIFFGDTLAPYSRITDNNQLNNGYAFFGQATYTLMKKLDITAGIRYDNENRNMTQVIQFYKEPNPPVNTVDPDKNSVAFSAISPKASISYRFTDKLMAYITYAKGFRAGGLNAYTNNSLYKSFDQETSDNYELGFKSTLLKNKLRFNISAFKIDWKDVQAYTVIDLATYQGAYVNAGSATSQGVEVELNVIPVKRLEFDFNLGYTDAKYNDLKAFDYSGFTEVNYKNKKVIYTPDITSMTALQYTIPFKIKEKMFGIKARGEYKYIGERYFTLDNKVKSDPYSLVNATLTFMSKYVEVSLWARNLADTKYLAFANAQSAFLAQPRMIGATLTAKF